MLKVSTKTAALMVGLTCAAVAGTGGAAIYAFHAASTVEDLVREGVADMMLAEDFDVALLRQRGYVAAFVPDGRNQRRLDETG